MEVTYPYTIKNCIGETLTFKGVQKEEGGDKLLVENFVSPGSGPVMHRHWLQDEVFTVVKGRLGYEIAGQPFQYAKEGETVEFKRGVPHRFWNAGEEVMHCKGYLQPANSIVFFLSTLFAAQNKTGSGRPEKFDSAYLLTKYASEYELIGLPAIVKKVILPLTYHIGRVTGKYKELDKRAPEPLAS